jgi:histidyl-tRNA synthetase
MDMYTTLVKFFQEGGIFMYPIAVVLGVGVAIALERFVYLLKETNANRRDYEAILPLLKQKRMREVVELSKKSRSAVCRIVADGLARMSNARRRQDIEYAMEEQLRSAAEHRAPHAVFATFGEHRHCWACSVRSSV